MKIVKRMLCILLSASLIACSAFRPSNETLRINCNVPETTLKVNGDKYKCPGEVKVRRDSKVTVEGSKEGYDTYNKLIDYHLSSTAKLDIVGTCLFFFPIIGLAFPGAWDLDETTINVVLDKNK